MKKKSKEWSKSRNQKENKSIKENDDKNKKNVKRGFNKMC